MSGRQPNTSISKWTPVYKKSRLREVPCVKVGRALKFDVETLDRYIEQHTIETID
jgi:hypothetical protein